MKKIPLLSIITAGTFLAATNVFAAGTFSDLVNTIISVLLNSVAALFISLAAMTFFYGIAKYILGLRQGDPKKVQDGNQFIIWGLVGLFVMFSIYGIIKFGQSLLFNGRDVSSITIPDFNAGGR